MPVAEWLAGAGGLAGIAATVLREMPSRGLRSRLKSDIELMQSLEPGKARELLQAHVERTIERLVAIDDSTRRDPNGIVLGLMFLGLGAFFVWKAVDSSGFPAVAWGVGAVFALLIGAVGFVQDVVKVERDGRGRPIRKTSTD